MNYIYQEDQISLKPERITDGIHPVYGDTTIFHDVVVASEMVQKYDDGVALKDRDELQSYTNTMDFSCAVVVGGHPQQGIISDIDQISGRTVNHRFVKNLNDPKTKRPNRAGIRADIEIFNKKVTPQLLDDMKKGVKPDVSIGFFYTKDETPGDYNGDKYDYVQRNMLHNHLAAGIDNGRCPSPYCGLGADEIRRQIASDPFAGFENFDACMAHMTKPKSEGGQGYSEETARKVCGKLQAQHEDIDGEEKALDKAKKKAVNALLEILDAIEAAQGELDAKKTVKETWWKSLNWKDEDLVPIFDTLDEETRRLIIEAGLCPKCGDAARTEAERAMSHFNISEEEWENLTPEEKQEYIDKLPEHGSGESDEEAIDEYDKEQDYFVEQELGKDKVLSYKEKAGHPDSDYAYIESGCEKKDGKTEQRCRHLLIHDPAHVRAALAALSGARSGKVPPYADKAKPKVCAAAKKFKIESTVCSTEKRKEDALDPYKVLEKSQEVLMRG